MSMRFELERGETALTQEGFNNWKKATKAFVEHLTLSEAQKQRRDSFMKELKAVRFLLRQSIDETMGCIR